MSLPIDLVLADLLAALRGSSNAVLVAPPGAGKTTAVAPALLDQPWCSGQILLLSPRRLAARAAAERIADQLGEKPGETVGYMTRLDSRHGPATRIIVMTEAIFVNRIIADPELSGVSAILFDEVHERSLDGDFGLALALEAQAAFRPDLRLVAMSATLDGARFAALLCDAPVIESAGKAHPLDIRWLGRDATAAIEDQMARAIVTAWREVPAGDLLAFLPGLREIDRVAQRLETRLPSAVVHALHGQAEPAAQRAAIRPDPAGARKVILATSIAETSLTLDGVRIVVDSGLARRAEYDRQSGSTRLVTRRASRAATIQRAGRAARQGPGVAYRLWEEGAQAGLAPFDPPEILESDLAGLMLSAARWGEADPARLQWLDPPPPAALDEARGRLLALGAVDARGAITPHGEAISALPLPPHLAHMLALAAQSDQADEAAELAVLLQERGLGGRSDDLAQRLSAWRADRSAKAQAARAMAARWAKLVAPGDAPTLPLAIILAYAFPGGIAQRRAVSGEDWASAGGKGFRLDPASALAGSEWLVVGEAQGSAQGARITAALATDLQEIENNLENRIATHHEARWNEAEKRVEPRRTRRLGAITIASGPDPAPDEAAITALLVKRLRAYGLSALPLGNASLQLLDRARYAGLDALSAANLLDEAELWLGPLLEGQRKFDTLSPSALHEALLSRLDWNQRQALEKAAPTHFTAPEGSRIVIDYAAEAGPTVEIRVQALFGLEAHPAIGQPAVPLVLSLTSPAGRPIQTTRDLPGFWRGSWRDVQREMKGRYPRHRWPDEPWTEIPSLRTKNRLANS